MARTYPPNRDERKRGGDAFGQLFESYTAHYLILEMIDLKKVQEEIWENKISKKFNTTDVNLEFCLTFDELAEAFRAYRKKLPDLGEEIADILIYLLSLSKMLNIDLEKEILGKLEKNKNREYNKVKGINIRTKG